MSAAKAMTGLSRLAAYRAQTGSAGLTPAQRRRYLKKIKAQESVKEASDG